MLNTIKSFIIVMTAPVLLVAIFNVNVINVSGISRGPAGEKSKTKSLRDRLQTYAVSPVR